MDLHVQQDERFQSREWTLERAGWIVMALFVAAGLAGLLGPGPLSWASARSPGGLVQIDYQRVTHNEADDALTLTFAAEAAQGGTVTVELTGEWPAGVDRQSVNPEPAEERAVPGGTVLEIPVERAGTTRVHVTFRPQEYGRMTGQLAVDGDQVSFTQLVLP